MFLSFFIILVLASKAAVKPTADHTATFFTLNNITYPVLLILFSLFIDLKAGGGEVLYRCT